MILNKGSSNNKKDNPMVLVATALAKTKTVGSKTNGTITTPQDRTTGLSRESQDVLFQQPYK